MRCLQSEAEYWSKSARPYWAERCYEPEDEILMGSEFELYRKNLADADCKRARSVYEQAFRRRHPELPLEFKHSLDDADWMGWIIESNAQDLHFCLTSELLDKAETEIARLKLEVPPYLKLAEAMRVDYEGKQPAALFDLYMAVEDLFSLVDLDHAGAQVLLAELSLRQDRLALAPGYALFLIERATWKGHRIAHVDELRRRAAANLPEDAIAELTALAARPEANYSDWLLARRKAGTLPE